MDVARLTEMNTMLKEELRRQERSTEREKQMQNLEYMKNVIFKVSHESHKQKQLKGNETNNHISQLFCSF